jgi:hypothetical protein
MSVALRHAVRVTYGTIDGMTQRPSITNAADSAQGIFGSDGQSGLLV